MPKINKNKILNFFKILGTSFFLQGSIQGAGMLVGFLIVRRLSIQEYACYTIANTMLGMMNVLSDCGISTSVFALGAKVWQDKIALGRILSTSIRFRNRFALISLIICTPITIYLLWKQEAPWWLVSLIVLSMIPTFKAQLTENLYTIIPNLHQELNLLQKNQLEVAFWRLFAIGLLMILFPFSWIAIGATGIPRYWGNLKLKKIAMRNAIITNDEDISTIKNIQRIIKRTIPGSIYFAFSGQISLWILSFLGKSTNVATWGALGRYSILFTVISSLFSMVLIPRYARKDNEKKALLVMSHQILLLLLLAGMILLGIIYLFSEQLLALLGKQYMGFNTELLIVSCNAFLSILVGTCYALNVKKGWIIHPLIDVLLNLLPVVIFAIIMPLNSLHSVLLYNFTIQITYLIGHYLIFIFHIYKYT